MADKVAVLIGAGYIGRAIIKAACAGEKIIVCDTSDSILKEAAEEFANNGFDTVCMKADLGSAGDLEKIITEASETGDVKHLVIAAGLGSQSPVGDIIAVDMMGIARAIDRFGEVIAEGGSGIVISAMSGHSVDYLTSEEVRQLESVPADDMSNLPFVEIIDASPKAYALAKYSNIIRARSAAAAWAKRGATINSISPGLVMTPVIRGILESDKGEGFRKLLAGSPAGRAATPSEVGELAKLLMTNRMITGTDVLIDGGITASKHAPQ